MASNDVKSILRYMYSVPFGWWYPSQKEHISFFNSLFTSQVVASGDRLDSNLVYFRCCNPTGVLPFVSVSAILMLNCVYVFLPVKSINEMKMKWMAERSGRITSVCFYFILILRSESWILVSKLHILCRIVQNYSLQSRNFVFRMYLP